MRDGKVQIAIRKQGRKLLGFVRMIGPKGSYVARVEVDYLPIIRKVVQSGYAKIGQVCGEVGATTAAIYEVGFFAKFGRWIKKTVKKIANSKFIKGIVKAVKWVANSPLVKGIVGIAKFIPFVGPIIHDAHKAIGGVEKVVKRAAAGIPGAQKIVAAIAQKAKEGNPTAVNIANRMLDAAKALPVPIQLPAQLSALPV